MRSWITSDGVLVVESENTTELFALKHINKILLKEYRHFNVMQKIENRPQTWNKAIELKNDQS